MILKLINGNLCNIKVLNIIKSNYQHRILRNKFITLKKEKEQQRIITIKKYLILKVNH
jgi:hypothetical protein